MRRILSNLYAFKSEAQEEPIGLRTVAEQHPLFPFLRRLLIVFCFVVSVLSFVTLILCVRLYINLNEIFSQHQVYTGWSSWKLMLPSFSSELSFCYFLTATSLLLWAASLYGFFRATHSEEYVLRHYIVLSLFIVIPAIVAIIYNLHGNNKLLDKALERTFESFVENHYRSGKMDMIFNSIVDHMQESHQCCGYRKLPEKMQNSPAHFAILYWLETTEWGQLQAYKISFSGNSMIEYVPRSCCRNKTLANCNIGIYQDRMVWNKQLEMNWTERIYTKSCYGFLQSSFPFQWD
uniref:Tetraspanin n=1 Tax=Trichuris muris TaxID=70415 RepID=A0A5S6QTP7_TRIMR